MKFIQNNAVALVAVIIALCAVFGFGQGQTTLFGSTDCQQTTCLTGGLRILDGVLESDGTFRAGSSGTQITRLNIGTCYIAPYATTIAATSSAAVDCQGTAAWSANGTSALAGVVKGDFVQATLSTTTSGSISSGLVITGASASTTAGHIQLTVANLTGTTFTWSTSLAATGTASYVVGN